MHIAAQAIVCAVLAHGEHGAVARLLTPADGLQPGYVRGGRSRRLRPVLLPGNLVAADYRARTEEQLAGLTVELVHSRAPLHAEPLAAAAIDWLCALTATALPEAQPYPHLYEALNGVLGAIEAAPAARGWGPSLVRYELLLLAELGFGLDLSACVATGVDCDLAFVSPKSGGAVSAAAGAPYAAQLLRLPAFLTAGARPIGRACSMASRSPAISSRATCSPMGAVRGSWRRGSASSTGSSAPHAERALASRTKPRHGAAADFRQGTRP